MKSALLAGFVSIVFLVGIGVGAFVLQKPPQALPPVVVASTQPAAQPAAGQPLAPPPVVLEAPRSESPAQAGAGTPDGPAAPPAGPAAPPPAEGPPTLSSEAQREGERAREANPEEPGNGRVTHLVYEFENEAEREAWEERRRASWQARLKREHDIKIRIMQEKVGLTDAQSGRLREILTAEFEERERLVTALANRELSRSGFDEGVQANLATARRALGQLLTAEQLQAYQQLKPREQVLRTETAGGF
jgi:hypothetical protein